MLFSWELITNTPLETAIFFICVLLSGIVRGCIGFGFSALVIASTSLFIDPVLIVPLLIILEIIASIHMLFGVWKDTLWQVLLYMTIGTLITTPVGVYILSITPQDTLRLIVSSIIFMMTLIYMRGYVYKGPLSGPVLTCVGCISGMFNGMAAVGGLVIATFLASAKFPIRNVRATMVIFFFGTEIIFLVSAAATDVYNSRVFNTFFFACIPMFVGIVLGSKLFHRLDEKKLRRLVLWLLSLLSIIGLIRALSGFIT